MTKVKRTGGGRFDPDEPFMFFLAMHVIARLELNAPALHPWTLIGMDVIRSRAGVQELKARVDYPDSRTMLDSGVYWLASRHAKRRGITLPEAFQAAPESVDGFDRLLGQYIDIARGFEDRLWGYVELDQGGIEGKRKTRAYLEEQGLRPIPVYHPLGDGFDYLDELLDTYDRVAIGNMVSVRGQVRNGLLALVWERVRRVRHKVWIHLLGYTPDMPLNVYPINSTDSSAHVFATVHMKRMCNGQAMLARFGMLEDIRMAYDQGLMAPEERGYAKKVQMLAWIARSEVEAWRRQWHDEARLLPVSVFPKPHSRELPPRAQQIPVTVGDDADE